MPTNDGSKQGRGAYKIGDPLSADTGGAFDTSPDEGVGPPGSAGKRRGPYRTSDLSTGNSDADILRDPQVAAFVEALTRLRDPQQRALLEGLVRDLARQSGTKKRV